MCLAHIFVCPLSSGDLPYLIWSPRPEIFGRFVAEYPHPSRNTGGHHRSREPRPEPRAAGPARLNAVIATAKTTPSPQRLFGKIRTRRRRIAAFPTAFAGQADSGSVWRTFAASLAGSLASMPGAPGSEDARAHTCKSKIGSPAHSKRSLLHSCEAF